MKWVYLAIAIIAEVTATSALEASEGFTKFTPSLIAFVGYMFVLYFLALTLKYISVGVAYAIWGGIGIILVALVGYFQYNQKLDAAAIIGIAFITMGVIVINVFSNTVSH